MKHIKRIPIPKKHHIPLSIVIIAAIISSTGLVLTLLQKSSPAFASNLYLTQASRAAAANQDVSYTLRILPGTAVDTVTATLAYDPSKLAFKSVDYKESPFTAQIPAIKNSDSVTLQAAKFNGAVTKDSLFANALFTTLQAGDHTVKISAGNAARAGAATHPLLNGVATIQPQEEQQAAKECQGDNCSPSRPASSIITSPLEASPSNPVVSAGQSLLQAAGLPPETARRSAPWLLGLIVCLIAAIPATILVIRHRRHSKTPINASSGGIVKSDQKDTTL